MIHPTTVIFSIDLPETDKRKALTDFQLFLIDKGVAEYVVPLIGCYKGEQEPAFIMAKHRFDDIVRNSGHIDKQESLLIVDGSNKAYAYLEYLEDGHVPPKEYLGSMCNVSEEVARSHESWTYRPDMDAWYVCAKINPDHAHEIEVQSSGM